MEVILAINQPIIHLIKANSGTHQPFKVILSQILKEGLACSSHKAKTILRLLPSSASKHFLTPFNSNNNNNLSLVHRSNNNILLKVGRVSHISNNSSSFTPMSQ